jgi:hypothetical protein
MQQLLLLLLVEARHLEYSSTRHEITIQSLTAIISTLIMMDCVLGAPRGAKKYTALSCRNRPACFQCFKMGVLRVSSFDACNDTVIQA